jgi:capsular exopolysaccharide synthesis family protein
MFDDDGQPNPGAHRAESPSFNLRRAGWFLAERWWVIAAGVALAGLVTIVYLVRAPRIYAATAVVKFESETPKALKLDGLGNEDYRSDDIRQAKLKEFQEIIQSRVLLTQVIERNNLAANPSFRPKGEPPSAEKLAGRLRRMLQVQQRPGTRLIDVTAESTDPALAAQLANSVVRELIRQEAESSKAASRAATAFLTEEAQHLQQQLTECDTRLQSYKDQSLSLEQRQAVVNETLRDVNRQVSEAKVERIRLESEYAPARDLADNLPKLLQVPRIAADPTVMALQASLAQQEVEFANVRQVYMAKHPAYIQAAGKLAELRQALSNATIEVAQTMRLAYENAHAREITLTKELDQQETTIRNLNTQSIPYNTLLRDREQYRALYDAVVKHMGEAAMAGNLDTTYLQVFQPADVPRNSVKPRRLIVLATGLFVGALAGLLVNFGWMLWDDSLKTLAEAEHFLQLTVLGTIPRIKMLNDDRTHIVVSNEQPSAGSQSFRYLRTSLALNVPQSHRCSYLFTSAMPNEGKTFCAMNFAASLARQGLRTLLVDCDLQRPTMSKVLLGNAYPVAGVADYLAGNAFETRSTEIENLSFCSAGTPLPNSSELLAQRRLTEFLVTALQQYDRVVVDSAPIFGVSDTLLLVTDVHAVCLVVRAGKTSREAVIRAVQTLVKAGAQLSGVVLNDVPESRMAAYGNPYYDYGYKTKKTVARWPVNR